MQRRSGTPWKLAGIAILLVPILLLLLLAASETFGGDIGGLQHLAEAVPLVILALLAWRFPAAIGRLLGWVGVGLAILCLVFSPDGLSLEETVITELLFLAPPMLAGLLLLRAARARA